MLSCANSLRDTVGITYQNVVRSKVSEEVRTEDVSEDQDFPGLQLRSKRTGRKSSFQLLSQIELQP